MVQKRGQTVEEVIFIYGLVDDNSGAIFYVGNTSVPASRFLRHRWLRRRTDFEMQLLEACFGELDGAEAEQRWIDFGRDEGWPLENVKPAPRKGISRRRIAQIEADPIWRARAAQ